MWWSYKVKVWPPWNKWSSSYWSSRIKRQWKKKVAPFCYSLGDTQYEKIWLTLCYVSLSKKECCPNPGYSHLTRYGTVWQPDRGETQSNKSHLLSGWRTFLYKNCSCTRKVQVPGTGSWLPFARIAYLQVCKMNTKGPTGFQNQKTIGVQPCVHFSNNVLRWFLLSHSGDYEPKPLEHCTWKVPNTISFQVASSYKLMFSHVFTKFLFI